MWAKGVAITFLLSSLQTEFKCWIQDISSIYKGSACARLCAITADELAELQDNTTVRRVFRDVGVPLLLKFLDLVPWRSFLALRYKILRIVASFGCTSLYERLFPLLMANLSTFLSRSLDKHLRPTLRFIFARELAADISSLVVAKLCQIRSQTVVNMLGHLQKYIYFVISWWCS